MQRLPDDPHGSETYTWNVVWTQEGIAYLGRDYLWRWDGKAMERIGSVSFGELRGMTLDPDGKIWLAGVNTIGVYDTKSGAYSSRIGWLPTGYRQFGEAWTLHHDGTALWMGTDRALFRMTGNQSQVWEFGSQHRVIFLFTPSGMFVHETNVGLWEIRNGEKVLVSDDPRLAERSVLYLEEFEDGSLLGLSGVGLFRFNKSRELISVIDISAKLLDLKISTVTRVDEETLAVGTLGNGLVFLTNSGKVYYRIDDKEFLNVTILFLSADPYGKLWVLDTTGVQVLSLDKPFGTLPESLSQPIDVLNALAQSDDSIYVSSCSGVYKYSAAWRQPDSAIQLSCDPCYVLDVFGDGIIFEGYNSLWYTEGDKVEIIYRFPAAITTFAHGPGGLLYLAFMSELGVYRRVHDGAIEVLGKVESASNLQEIGLDERGHLWGWAPRAPLIEVWVDEKGHVQERQHANVAGYWLAEEDIRMAVAETGPVILFGDKLIRYISPENGWEEAILPEPYGLTEAFTFSGSRECLEGWLVEWDRSYQYYRVHQLSWTSGSGLEQHILPWPDMRGIGRITRILEVDLPEIQLVIGGTEGIFLAGSGLSEQVGGPGQPLILGGSPAWGALPADRFRYGKDLVDFRFRMPNGGEPYPVRYQSRIEGLENWSEPTEQAFRSVGQLRAGLHTLEVRILDPFGRVSPVARHQFQVLPPWYWSGWAWVCYGILVLVFGYIVLQITTRRMLARQAELESQVAERTAALRKAVAFKDELIANLSHEVRNPLNGIIGLIRQLREGVPPPANFIRALRGAAGYLHATVEEVLDFSRLEAGLVKLTCTPVDLREVSDGVLEIYREQAAAKSLEFKAEIQVPEGKAILSDSGKLQQIIGNLAGNAVKFTDKGYVHVHLELRPIGETHGILNIVVTDTGVGIPQEAQERVFDKFVRLEHEGFRKGGTGIGLALVKSYADRMGARLTVQSKINQGSSFSLEIPVEVCDLVARGNSSNPVSVSEKRLRVLVVEDEAYNRMVLEDLLTGMGCQVFTAERGDVGLEMGLRHTFDVIFLDWELPGMNGAEIARRLRKDERVANSTRLYALTAYVSEDMERKCLDAGMDAFLKKPIDERLISQLLAGKVSTAILVRGRGKLGEMAGEWTVRKERFLEFWKGYLDELEGAMEQGEPETIRQVAHKFLGLVQMVEVKELPELLRAIQDASRNGDLASARQAWQAFRQKIPQFHEEWDLL